MKFYNNKGNSSYISTTIYVRCCGGRLIKFRLTMFILKRYINFDSKYTESNNCERTKMILTLLVKIDFLSWRAPF